MVELRRGDCRILDPSVLRDERSASVKTPTPMAGNTRTRSELGLVRMPK
jgi:hypothetical protein